MSGVRGLSLMTCFREVNRNVESACRTHLHTHTHTHTHAHTHIIRAHESVNVCMHLWRACVHYVTRVCVQTNTYCRSAMDRVQGQGSRE
jgi:hypothetical protein